MNEVLQLNIKRISERDYVLKDAQNAEDWPENELYSVVIDPEELTVEGTPEGIRWLYDYFEWAEDEFRLEGAQWMADDCRDWADALWEVLPDDPPGRQRAREVRLS